MRKYITPYSVALAVIVVISILLRFWKVNGLFYFGIDEEYQATYAATIVKDFHLVWIGVSAADTGYYLGPGFTYLNAVLFWFSHYSPAILGYFAALLGVCTTLSIGYVSKKLFSKKVSLISTALYGLSTLMVFYDKRFWNPSFVPILSIWLFFSLIKSIKNPRWLILTAVLIAGVYHSHITLWLYWPFILGVIIYIRKKLSFKVVLAALASFLAVFSPLIVFDYVHNFDNLLMPLRMIKTVGHSHTFSSLSHLADFFLVMGRLLYIQPFSSVANEAVPATLTAKSHAPLLLSLTVICAFIYVALRQKSFTIRALLSVCALFFVAFVFYPGKVDEYYLLGMFPLMIMIIALALKDIKNSLLLIGVITLFAFCNIYSVLTVNTNYGLSAKIELIQKISPYLKEKEFALSMAGTYRAYAGWRYLFKVYGKTPAKSETDSMFGWLYPDEISNVEPKTQVVVSDVDLPIKDLQKKVAVKGFRAYLLKNK